MPEVSRNVPPAVAALHQKGAGGRVEFGRIQAVAAAAPYRPHPLTKEYRLA